MDSLRTQDAIKFLELLLSECSGADDHSWWKCRRCLAFSELEGHQPLARGFVTDALEALRVKVVVTGDPNTHMWTCTICGGETTNCVVCGANTCSQQTITPSGVRIGCELPKGHAGIHQALIGDVAEYHWKDAK